MSEPMTAPKDASNDAPRADFEILYEDGETRITRWRFDPGAQTGWHHHAVDYVTIQESGGELRLERDDGSVTHVEYEPGRTVRYAAPIRHNATNVSGEEVRVTEIEYKTV